MSNPYTRSRHEPISGAVQEDTITTASMIRSTDFQQKLAAARVMREKVMQQREQEAAMARRKHGQDEGLVESPSFIRSVPRKPMPEAMLPELKGPVLESAPRRPACGPSFQLLADPEPNHVTSLPPFAQQAVNIAKTTSNAGLAASKEAAVWVKDKATQVAAHAPSMAQSKAVAHNKVAQVAAIAKQGGQEGRKLGVAALSVGQVGVSRMRVGLAGLAGALVGYQAALAAKSKQFTLPRMRRLPYRAIAAGLACLLAVGLIFWSFGGSQQSEALAFHQAKSPPPLAPIVQDTRAAFVVPALAVPAVGAVAQDHPTPKLAAYDLAIAQTDALPSAELALATKPVGPVAVNSAVAKSAWVPAQQFEPQNKEALSLVSRSGFRPGSLPNSTVVDSDTPRLAPDAVAIPEANAIPVAVPAQQPSTKYAVKRSLRPTPRALTGQ